MRGELRRIKGVGEKAEGIMLDILDKGASVYYERLLE